MFATLVAKAQTNAGASSTSHYKQGAGVVSPATREAVPNGSCDFSKISIFPPDRKNQPQSESALGTSRLSVIVQPKLVVGPVNDPLEREADCVADQVMAMPAQISVGGTNPRIQPFSSSSASEALAGVASASVNRALAGSGTALHPTLQQDMERRFGYDFSRVRIYADGEAGRSAEDMNAQAYTVGHRVVFAPGRFVPRTAHGLRLLSHELTHVVQQSGGSGGAGVRERPPCAVQRQPDPDIDLARKLAKKLKDGKRDDVLADIEALSQSDRDKLEVAVTQAFALEKPTADDLRRIIRFIRHKPAVGAGGVFTASGGATEKKAGAKIGSGKVEVKTGVSVNAGAAGSTTEAYSLSYAGDDADKMHWMQFAWREVIPEYPAKAAGGKPSKQPMDKELSHSGRDYRLTTSPAKPVWLTDSGTKKSPFYEENTTVNRSAKELTMADFPSSMDMYVAPLFKDPSSAPTRVVSHFHASTYLIRNMDVVYRADIDLIWEFTSAKPSPVKATVTGGIADHLDLEQRASLVIGDPNVDFLPGPKPDPLGEFAPIQELFHKGSLTDQQWADSATTDVQRYADIVTIAHAEWINEVAGMPSKNINIAADLMTDTKPGLNYSAKLGKPGKTGYVDSKGQYHNPDVPLDPADPLPSIAITLGPDAFKPGKESALETLRHELRHATHEQSAVGWILKWREEGGRKSFKEWLAAQHKAKKISDADYALVSTGVSLDTAATEVFAHIEGIITGLPFLPPQPDLNLIKGSQYPAAIDQVFLLRAHFDAGGAGPVQKPALQRLHDFCCQVLDPTHRDGFVAWIRFLLNLASLKASSKAEKDTQALVVADFKGHESFLKQLLASVQKTC
jgi:hypothetical protein